MILIDTSAWVEYLRDGHQATADDVEGHLIHGDAITTEPVVMEILQGGRSAHHVEDLKAVLSRADLSPVESSDFSEAALLYRLCRINGETVPSSIDCLIAAIAIRSNVAVLHHDKDFAALARHTPLAVRSA